MKVDLMDEMKKIRWVVEKHELRKLSTIMVFDAITGRNVRLRATQCQESVPIGRAVMAKLDGTATGGMVFAIANELKNSRVLHRDGREVHQHR